MTDAGVPPDPNPTAATTSTVVLAVDGVEIIADPNRMLLDVLRLNGFVSVKDGCSPQGQCGCCTVLVDGAPRVACVTPVRRMKGKTITTVDGLAPDRRNLWAEALTASGGSQCGFCTPGIICRLEGVAMKGADLTDRDVVDKALLAHLCRCTGWQTIREAATAVAIGARNPERQPLDNEAAARRAFIEGGAPQLVGPEVALGRGGFAADTAPHDALVAVPDGDGWFVGADLDAARVGAGKVQGRRSTVRAEPPLSVPAGDWVHTLRTCWIEPAYLETDAVWCEPGGEPVGPLLNGGAFGAKSDDSLRDVAKRLACEHGRCVKVVYDREDVVARGTATRRRWNR
ncbi:MAG: 2Fe-2S iron-sulfur cluster binding domain-containing protein [Actinobacteria bacterium]|nr:2Fe-2S iron-sulfur cluster binding domain-containing protein [Actinomycetota bacterium]